MKHSRNAEDYLSIEFEKLQHQNSAPNWLSTLRSQKYGNFQSMGFPTLKDEEWRYFDTSPLQSLEFKLPTGENREMDPIHIDNFKYKNLDAFLLVYLDGKFDAAHSQRSGFPQNGTFIDLASAIREDNEELREHIAGRRNHHENSLTALNIAFMQNGSFIRIPDNTKLDKPIHLLYANSGSGRNLIISPHNSVIVGKNCEVSLIESHIGFGQDKYFNNTVTELIIDENSVVSYNKIQQDDKDAYHIGSIHVTQNKNSTFTSNSVTFGGYMTRNNINAYLDGKGCTCNLNGLYLGNNHQIIDNHTRIDHAHPNCDSYELYKGILNGHASAVFNGKIYVHPDAQKTDAKQTNRVLLLSDNAKINTKPELEIYADDVKCTHGATIGQLDDEAIFYLRSRGIQQDHAFSILTEAFAGEVLANINIDVVRNRVNDFVISQLR